MLLSKRLPPSCVTADVGVLWGALAPLNCTGIVNENDCQRMNKFFSVQPISDFALFYKKAKKIRHNSLISWHCVRELNGLPPPHGSKPHILELSVIASKKSVHKKAVIRNRAKRRLRAAAMCVLKRELTTEPCDHSFQWVLSAQLVVVTLPWQVLLSEVDRAWKELRRQKCL